ncbi:MAG: hypothetical protein VXW32_10115 [Myxococcota bacterium]|nr:hypothetical protein [Myxococcota bacterium]
MSSEVIEVRDALEATCIARLAGANPRYIEKKTLESGIEQWSFNQPGGATWRQDFNMGDGSGSLRTLTEQQVRELAYGLVASVPARTDLMGAAYLREVVLVLAEALGLLESVQEDTTDLLGLITRLSLASQITAPFDLEKMAVPPGQLALTKEHRQQIPECPAPWESFEGLLAESWRVVTSSPERRLLRHETGAMLLLKCSKDNRVEAAKVLEGPDALMGWAVNGFSLTRPTAVTLLNCVQAGASLNQAVDALKAQISGHLNVLGSLDAGGNRVLHFLLVDEDSDRRRAAVLALVVSAEQQVLGSQLVQGPPGFDQMMGVLERVSLEKSSDPQMRLLARRQAFSNEARLAVAPLLSQTQDRKKLSQAFRPRPGDAAKVFLPELAPAIEAASDRLWDKGVTIAPSSGQTEVSALVAFKEDFDSKAPVTLEFAQAFRPLAAYLQPGRPWVSWTFHEPGEEKGTRYEGLVWIDDHWAFFPKPWKLLPRH